MTRDALEFDLRVMEPPRMRLPDTDVFLQVGATIPSSVGLAGPRLGLLLGGSLTTPARKEFSDTLFVLLAILALAREEDRTEVTLAQIAERALLPSKQADAWQMDRSLGRELARVVAPSPPGDPDDIWPSCSTALVQIRQRRSGLACVSSGPYRLNPRYRVEGDIFRLRALFPLRGLCWSHRHDVDHAPVPYDVACADADALTAVGREADAVDVMVEALANAGSLPNRACAEALRRLAGFEMQLGWSTCARRHALALAGFAERLADPVLVADALHLQALIARQLEDFEGAARLDERALAALGASPTRRSADRRVFDLQRSLGVSYSQAVRRRERVGRFVARGARDDHRWGHATRLFRLSIGGATDGGDASQVAHSLMRLACHRLAQHQRLPLDEREVLRAAESVAAMNIPTRVIWQREMASERLLRLGAEGAPDALATLAACRGEAEARGYAHQIRLVDDTLRRIGVPPRLLSSPP